MGKARLVLGSSKARKQQEKVGLMQMVTSIDILTKVGWRLAKSPKNGPWRDWRACYTATGQPVFVLTFYHSYLHTPFSGRAICWTRSFVLSHLSPISVLCRTHSLSLQAVYSAHPPSSLFPALSRHICCSSPPDLSFYFWLLASF